MVMIKMTGTKKKIYGTILILVLGIVMISITILYYQELGNAHNSGRIISESYYFIDLFLPLIMVLWIILIYRRYSNKVTGR